MNLGANSVEDYLSKIPEERQEAFNKLRETIIANLPDGFSEELSYGMVGYVVPKSTYPAGYHCDPKLPLPFLSIANQKNFISVYHMGIYASPELMEWFVAEYPKYVKTKLDMGKSCIRFKNVNKIPFELIGELVSKMTAEQWIEIYETNVKG
ncbi:MAG: DUF1801 domain-containing protein [Bacteroidia bacterium]